MSGKQFSLTELIKFANAEGWRIKSLEQEDNMTSWTAYLWALEPKKHRHEFHFASGATASEALYNALEIACQSS